MFSPCGLEILNGGYRMIGGELTQVESTNGLKFPSIKVIPFASSDTGSYEPAGLTCVA